MIFPWIQNRGLRVDIHLLVQVSRRCQCAPETRRAGAGVTTSCQCARHRPVLISVFSFNSPSNVSVHLFHLSHGMYFIAPPQLLKFELSLRTSSMANPRLE